MNKYKILIICIYNEVQYKYLKVGLSLIAEGTESITKVIYLGLTE